MPSLFRAGEAKHQGTFVAVVSRGSPFCFRMTLKDIHALTPPDTIIILPTMGSKNTVQRSTAKYINETNRQTRSA